MGQIISGQPLQLESIKEVNMVNSNNQISNLTQSHVQMRNVQDNLLFSFNEGEIRGATELESPVQVHYNMVDSDEVSPSPAAQPSNLVVPSSNPTNASIQINSAQSKETEELIEIIDAQKN